MHPYSSSGLIKTLYVYKMVFGLAPQDFPRIAFKRLSLFLHLEMMSSMCASKVRCWSNVMPRNLTCLLYLRSSPLSHSLGELLFTF